LEEIIICGDEHAKNAHRKDISGDVFVSAGDANIKNKNKRIHKYALIPTEATGRNMCDFAGIETGEGGY
jgi:hypothetical protein